MEWDYNVGYWPIGAEKQKHNPRMYQHFPNENGNVGYTSLKKARFTSHIFRSLNPHCLTLKNPS